MKKLLGILAALGLTATASSAVVSCGTQMGIAQGENNNGNRGRHNNNNYGIDIMNASISYDSENSDQNNNVFRYKIDIQFNGYLRASVETEDFNIYIQRGVSGSSGNAWSGRIENGNVGSSEATLLLEEDSRIYNDSKVEVSFDSGPQHKISTEELEDADGRVKVDSASMNLDASECNLILTLSDDPDDKSPLEFMNITLAIDDGSVENIESTPGSHQGSLYEINGSDGVNRKFVVLSHDWTAQAVGGHSVTLSWTNTINSSLSGEKTLYVPAGIIKKSI